MFGIFGKRLPKAKAVMSLPEKYSRIYDILRQINIEGDVCPRVKKKSGFFYFIRRVIEYSHRWTKRFYAPPTVGITVGMVAVVGVIVGVATAVTAVSAGAMAIMIAEGVAGLVTAVAALLKSEEASEAEVGEGYFESLFFYAMFFAELAALAITTLFLSQFSFLFPLAAVIAIFSLYIWNGVKGVKGSIKEKPEMESESLPTTVSEVINFLDEKVRLALQRHRSRILDAESEFAGRLSKINKDLDKARSLIAKLREMLAAGEDQTYILPRLEIVEKIASEAEENLSELSSGKNEILKNLRVFETCLQAFKRLFERFLIEEEIDSISEQVTNSGEENAVFIKREMETFRQNAKLLIEAFEEACYITCAEYTGNFSGSLEKNARLIGEASYKAGRVLKLKI